MDNDDEMILTGCSVPYIHLFCTDFYLPFSPWMAHLFSNLHTLPQFKKKEEKKQYIYINLHDISINISPLSDGLKVSEEKSCKE